nr:unnamed protein product [Digitaria exilis]
MRALAAPPPAAAAPPPPPPASTPPLPPPVVRGADPASTPPPTAARAALLLHKRWRRRSLLHRRRPSTTTTTTITTMSTPPLPPPVVQGTDPMAAFLPHGGGRVDPAVAGRAPPLGLDVNVRYANILISSLEQSLDIRTSSHKAPSLIMSFEFTSAKESEFKLLA